MVAIVPTQAPCIADTPKSGLTTAVANTCGSREAGGADDRVDRERGAEMSGRRGEPERPGAAEPKRQEGERRERREADRDRLRDHERARRDTHTARAIFAALATNGASGSS